jgi:hypothetical protein
VSEAALSTEVTQIQIGWVNYIKPRKFEWGKRGRDLGILQRVQRAGMLAVQGAVLEMYGITIRESGDYTHCMPSAARSHWTHLGITESHELSRADLQEVQSVMYTGYTNIFEGPDSPLADLPPQIVAMGRSALLLAPLHIARDKLWIPVQL